MKIISIAWHILFIALIGIVQISFLSTWPQPISLLNLALSVIIFVTVMIRYSLGLWWAFGLGMMLELYSGLPFGFTVISTLLSVIFVYALFQNFFTNRSLYSLIILTFLGTSFYSTTILFFNLTSAVFGISVSTVSFDYWTMYFWQPLFNILIVGIIFAAFHFSTNRLKSIFLVSNDFYEKHKK